MRQGQAGWPAGVDEAVEIEGRSYPCQRIVRVTERSSDRNGQMLLMPQITLEGWWTNQDMASEEVIGLYRDHATSEQFHSEFKTDLDLERLPSGTFATNALVMALGCLTYNILRAIGQMGLPGEFSQIRHPAKRRRIRTVMQELICLAGRLLILPLQPSLPCFCGVRGGVRATCPCPLTWLSGLWENSLTGAVRLAAGIWVALQRKSKDMRLFSL